ncbi:MAG: lamin tail domain-containing protein, partial [Flavobacteriales bacterium]
SNTSISVTANYLYAITDMAGNIVATTSSSLPALASGSYQVFGISYSGTLDAASIAAGASIFSVSASDCAVYTPVPATMNLYGCATSSPCSSVLISEYIEGVGGGGPNGTSRALELFNTSLNTITLDNYALLQYSNGSQVPTDTLLLIGTLGPQGRYVIVSNTGTISQNVTSDLISAFINFTGNDAIALTRNDSIVDMIGIIGNDPGNNGWPVAAASTANNGMRRISTVQMPEGDWNIASTQWEIFASNDFSDLGLHTFQSCSNELLIGFVNSTLTIDEDLGNQNIPVAVDVQNLTSASVDVIVTLTGGTADGNDFTFVSPVTLSFDTIGAQTFELNVIDDNIIEGAETIVLTLTSSDLSIVWTQQEMTITILQSDANCDVGNPALANGIFQICNNGIALLQPDINEVGSGYVNVVADNSNNIVYTTLSDSIIASDLGTGNYQIYRVLYIGNLIDSTLQPGGDINQISADLCVSISAPMPLEIVTCGIASPVIINEVNADNPGTPDTQ